VALSSGAVRSRLRFGDETVRFRQVALLASVGKRLGDRLNVEAALGVILDGELDGRDVGVGGTVSLTGSGLVLAETRSRPFVLVSLTVSGSRTSAGEESLAAYDVRLGAAVGKTFWERVTPFLGARVFGGPVFWTRDGEDVTGQDEYHVTAGAGVTLQVPQPSLQLFVEIMPLGEQSLSGGLGWAF
jgi:hypothetical protein